MWGSRLTRIEIGLGYGASSLVRCLNVLLAHRARLHEVTFKAEPFSSVIPIALEVTLARPRRKKMDALVAALNQVSYGCHEVDIDSESNARTDGT